ncbi:hypothetical protein TIFTF001_030312 [Ficus carica]|uniref:Uncharacterized protein n=1 Tax=Ficus carica TaxID=3494 RepID=A0AA88J3L0_FICCA|nr:hypothetical protein TIFTF001_030312 [Ficus carica]
MVDVDVVIHEQPTSVVDRSAYNVDRDTKVSGNGCSTNSEKSSKIVQHAEKRTFSRVVKAVFFETILAKRVSDRKGISKKRPCLDLGRSTDEPMILAPAKVRTRTSSSSSSSTPKSIDSSKSLSESVKQTEGHKSTRKEKHTEKPHLSINTGLLLILISLAMTVLWGKLSAIVFTSIWLCFLPLWSYAVNPGPQNVTKSPEIESEDHKKKSNSIGRDCLKGSIIG